MKKVSRSKISELTAEIVGEREKIWLEAPPELERLKILQKGRGGNFAVRVYAYADTYRNQRNLWLFREGLKSQNLTAETAKLLLALFLAEMADRFEIWALDTPARLFRKVESLLAEAVNPQELVTLLDELLIYNNRWWLWLDSCISWFDPDKKIARDF